MKNELYYIKIGHVDFVPNGYFVKDNNSYIHVFSHRLNKRTYQKARRLGIIIFNPKSNNYQYQHCSNYAIGMETMGYITRFLGELKYGEVIFDSEKGLIKHDTAK